MLGIAEAGRAISPVIENVAMTGIEKPALAAVRRNARRSSGYFEITASVLFSFMGLLPLYDVIDNNFRDDTTQCPPPVNL